MHAEKICCTPCDVARPGCVGVPGSALAFGVADEVERMLTSRSETRPAVAGAVAARAVVVATEGGYAPGGTDRAWSCSSSQTALMESRKARKTARAMSEPMRRANTTPNTMRDIASVIACAVSGSRTPCGCGCWDICLLCQRGRCEGAGGGGGETTHRSY
jgi:hypothetical protein